MTLKKISDANVQRVNVSSFTVTASKLVKYAVNDVHVPAALILLKKVMKVDVGRLLFKASWIEDPMLLM